MPEDDYSTEWSNPGSGDNAEYVDDVDGTGENASKDSVSTVEIHPAWDYDIYWADGSDNGGTRMEMVAWLKGLGPSGSGDFTAWYKYGGEWLQGVEAYVGFGSGWDDYHATGLSKVPPNKIKIRGHRNQTQGRLLCDEVHMRYY